MDPDGVLDMQVRTYVDINTKEDVSYDMALKYPVYGEKCSKSVTYRCDLPHTLPGRKDLVGFVNIKYRAAKDTHHSLKCQIPGSKAGYNTPLLQRKNLPEDQQGGAPQQPSVLLGGGGGGAALPRGDSAGDVGTVAAQMQTGMQIAQGGVASPAPGMTSAAASPMPHAPTPPPASPVVGGVTAQYDNHPAKELLAADINQMNDEDLLKEFSDDELRRFWGDMVSGAGSREDPRAAPGVLDQVSDDDLRRMWGDLSREDPRAAVAVVAASSLAMAGSAGDGGLVGGGGGGGGGGQAQPMSTTPHGSGEYVTWPASPAQTGAQPGTSQGGGGGGGSEGAGQQRLGQGSMEWLRALIMGSRERGVSREQLIEYASRELGAIRGSMEDLAHVPGLLLSASREASGPQIFQNMPLLVAAALRAHKHGATVQELYMWVEQTQPRLRHKPVKGKEGTSKESQETTSSAATGASGPGSSETRAASTTTTGSGSTTHVVRPLTEIHHWQSLVRTALHRGVAGGKFGKRAKDDTDKVLYFIAERDPRRAAGGTTPAPSSSQFTGPSPSMSTGMFMGEGGGRGTAYPTNSEVTSGAYHGGGAPAVTSAARPPPAPASGGLVNGAGPSTSPPLVGGDNTTMGGSAPVNAGSPMNVGSPMMSLGGGHPYQDAGGGGGAGGMPHQASLNAASMGGAVSSGAPLAHVVMGADSPSLNNAGSPMVSAGSPHDSAGGVGISGPDPAVGGGGGMQLDVTSAPLPSLGAGSSLEALGVISPIPLSASGPGGSVVGGVSSGGDGGMGGGGGYSAPSHTSGFVSAGFGQGTGSGAFLAPGAFATVGGAWAEQAARGTGSPPMFSGGAGAPSASAFAFPATATPATMAVGAGGMAGGAHAGAGVLGVAGVLGEGEGPKTGTSIEQFLPPVKARRGPSGAGGFTGAQSGAPAPPPLFHPGTTVAPAFNPPGGLGPGGATPSLLQQVGMWQSSKQAESVAEEPEFAWDMAVQEVQQRMTNLSTAGAAGQKGAGGGAGGAGGAGGPMSGPRGGAGDAGATGSNAHFGPPGAGGGVGGFVGGGVRALGRGLGSIGSILKFSAEKMTHAPGAAVAVVRRGLSQELVHKRQPPPPPPPPGQPAPDTGSRMTTSRPPGT